jgi:hypothetical protein
VIRKLSYAHYLVKKAARLGPRKSFIKLRSRVLKRLARETGTHYREAEIREAQEVIETAAHAYQPEKYGGTVLLLLASDRPPHMNFLPGWQPLVGNLHTLYVGGHHGELLSKNNVRSVANAIGSHLGCVTDDNSLSIRTVAPGSRDLTQKATSTRTFVLTNSEAGSTQ